MYFGLQSHCINVYGFKSKGEFPKNYKDFIREHGAPSTLRRDNAKEEQSEEVLRMQRQMYIKTNSLRHITPNKILLKVELLGG